VGTSNATIQITSEHVPVARGLSANFKETPRLFVCKSDGTGIVRIIDKFLRYCIKLSRCAGKLYRKNNAPLMAFLASNVKMCQDSSNGNASRYSSLIKKILARSEILPIIGYNSGRYDLPLLMYYGFLPF